MQSPGGISQLNSRIAASSAAATALLVVLVNLTGCGSSSPADSVYSQPALLPAPEGSPDGSKLQSLLMDELLRLGIDPDKQTSKAPTTGSEVFDLVARLVDPDGEGGDPPTGVELSWTERVIGDYSQDGLVNIADLTPLGISYLDTVEYEDAMEHNGFASWPTGDPDNDGGVEPGEPPEDDSGAANWRRARTDGNGDGEINVSDITAIAQHWNERLDGYRIYRRGPDEEQFSLLEDPAEPGQPWLIARDTTFPQGASTPDPRRPVCYTALDEFSVVDEYIYYVVAYDGADDQEGPASIPASTMGYEPPDELAAELVATPLSGTAPLTVNFNAGGSAIPEGVLPNYEWDWHGDGVYDLDSGTDYAVSYTFTTGGEHPVLMRVTDTLGGQDTDTVTVTVNEPPVAALEVDISEGDVPLYVSFDASASTDPDGAIALYEWDLNGDRVYEISSADQDTASFTYDQIGTFFPSLRITDEQGATAMAELTIIVHGWWIVTLASEANYGLYNSMAIIAGRPAVAFYQHGTQADETLWYIRALDPAGRLWGEPVLVDGDGVETDGSPEARGPECSMIEIEGTPAIAYFDDNDFVGQLLRYIRAEDAEGTSWGESKKLTELLDGRIGWNNSLAIVNGKPAIACNSKARVGEGRILCYFHANDAIGDDWPETWNVVDTALLIEDIQLTTLGDEIQVPAISYVAFNLYLDPYGYDGGIRMVLANDIDGFMWGEPSEIASFDGIADHESFDGLSMLRLASGPVIVFAGELTPGAGYFLHYMASESQYGSEWPAPTPISPELVSYDTHSSIALIDGKPAIAFANFHRYSVEYLPALDDEGSSWAAEPQLIDGGVANKVECCLLEVDGRPAVSYYDHNDGDLRFAVYY